MAPEGLGSSFLAAVQASLSVLLVIFYGVLASQWQLLDSKTGKKISKICVKMFLPALLLTKIGSELHAESARRYGIILLWAIICHVVSFLIGIAAHLLFKFPDWITAAIMFNNTTSYPLLLIESLDETGILSSLITSDETTKAAIERAKSYFLVFATVSSCLTFAVGPRLIDSEHAPDVSNDKAVSLGESTSGAVITDDENATEDTALLTAAGPLRDRQSSVVFFPSKSKPDSLAQNFHDQRRAYGISADRWLRLHPNTRWWLLFLYDFLNAPLLGAMVGAIIGLAPPLHRAFFANTSDGGIFTAWLTASFKTIGQLFVPLPVVIAGVSLHTSMKRLAKGDTSAGATPWLATTFILVIRFVLWPVMSVAVIYALAKKTDFLGGDPMLYFTLMLMPTGPPAMKLISMIQVSDAPEEEEMKISKLLTVRP